MSRLHQLPFSELKIDRSLVSELGRSEDAEILVRSTIDLAHALGLEACAEGIERAECRDVLHRLGCDTAQGYFFARPMAPRALIAWMEARNGSAGSESSSKSG